MATWITHLRIAEQLQKDLDLNHEAFLLGNLGPDSGVPNEDWSKFDPPKKITHFLSDAKINGNCIDANRFFKTYLTKIDYNQLSDRDSFLLGYYVHLLTDICWSNLHTVIKERNPDYAQTIKDKPAFIWEVKKDWYGQDFVYLNEHKENVFNEIVLEIDSVEDYLDYFPKGAFTQQLNYIQNYYSEENRIIPTDRYLTKIEMDDFVGNSIKSISEILKQQFNVTKKISVAT
ncbi:MAG: zinc dependent phospholipase C family protein [Clostridiales bacterium]|nr:zinc dependent phospholipase C family protein [Clostridiales bacterium]